MESNSKPCEVLSDAVLLTLDQGCIETTARRAHQRLVSKLLEGEVPSPSVESAVDLLAEFLTVVDFRSVRARDPDLAAGLGWRVRIWRDGTGKLAWEKLSR
jgi:hypothetical protein